MGCPGGHIRPDLWMRPIFTAVMPIKMGVMTQECDLKEREGNILAQCARGMQVQSDSGLLYAITAARAVLTLQWL